jgi:signal transduction histidine kinase/ActR/RegA family two-component response regulator
MDILLFSIATVLQIVAMLFALWMIFHSSARVPWILLGVAMCCMMASRVVALATGGMQFSESFPESTYKSFIAANAVLVSLLLLLALFSIRRVALAQQRAEAANQEAVQALQASEQRHRLSEQRLRIALDAAGLGEWQLDPASGIIAGTGHCHNCFRAAENGPFTLDAMRQMIHPEDGQRVVESVARALRERTIYDEEYRVLRPDGSIGWILASGRGEYDPSGKPVLMTGVTLDISTRKQAEQQLEALLERERAARAAAERASFMKDEFLATLSHELRTPLTAIQGWCEILRLRHSEEDLAQGLEVIRRNAEAQTKIIEDLLDMSRIISGKIRLDIQRVELPAIVAAALETVRPAADAKGIHLHADLETAPANIAADPNRLQQILWNLLSNAIKFTPKDGQVRVSVELCESHLEIVVSDTGEGIKPEFLPFVFDRFRQADGSTTRKHRGLGLGLAIVKNLVELHGGTVQAKSDGEGRGSAFFVALPLRAIQLWQLPEALEPQSDQALNGKGRAERTSLSGLKVLVVDDERDVRKFVQRLLEDCDATVATAASMAEGLTEIERQAPDLLISDIGMPEHDGFELIRRLRDLPASSGGKIPAIALTAYARSEDRRRILLAGFQMHAAKPVQAAELVAMAASLCGRTGRMAGSVR